MRRAAAALATLLGASSVVAQSPPGPPAGSAQTSPPGPPASSAPASAWDAHDAASLAPYGPGVSVQLTASGEPVTVYVAPHVAGSPRPDDDAFAKVGKTPITVQLPNGGYLVETEGFDTTRGSLDLVVDGQPRQLMIHNGSQNTHTLGNLTTAIGIAAVLGGIAAFAGGRLGHATDLNKPAVTIPLFASGAVLIAAGVTMTVVSQTDIVDTSSGRTPDGKPRRAAGAGLRLGVTF